MAKKIISAKVLVGLFVATSVMSFFTSCGDNELETGGATVETFTERTKKDVPQDTIPEKDPELEFFLIPVHEVDSNSVAIADTIGERTTQNSWIQTGKAKLSLKEYDYITEMKYKVLNPVYSNTNKSVSEPTVEYINGDKRYTTRCSFAMEDGNLGYIDAESWQLVRKINGQDAVWTYAKLSSFDVISLNNVDKAKTRGTYIADSCYTEAKVNLHYVYEDSNIPAFDVVLVDTCFRKFLAEDEVANWDYDNVTRKVLTSTTEHFGFRKIAHKLSGDIEYLEKSTILYYGITGIDEYDLVVKSFGFVFANTDGVQYGETKLARVDGPWTYSRRTFAYGSLFNTPSGDKIPTKYTGFTEGVVYDDGDVKVTAPVLDITVNEGKTEVNSIAGDDWYDKARFNNTVNADYQGYAQTASESVILLKEKVREVFRGWDENSKRKIITLWNVLVSADYVIRDSEGNENRTNYAFNIGWLFEPNSFWSVNSSAANYFTGNVIATVNGSQKSAKSNDNNATCRYTENNHSFDAEVTVANGVQHDTWVAKTPNDISIERDGSVVQFGHDEYNMSEGTAKLGAAVAGNSEQVYPYTHALTFGFGGVTAEATVKGEIKVKEETPVIIPDVPTFFGELKGITCIVANNPEHTDYLYTMLAHLKNGRVIPGVWNRSGEIQWYLADEQNGSDNLNGCVYVPAWGKWVPVHAWDSPDCLQYDTASGANADNQMYSTANQWNWDEGRKVNGHPSVTTNRISFSMVNGTVTATDTYTGASLGSWTYKQ